MYHGITDHKEEVPLKHNVKFTFMMTSEIACSLVYIGETGQLIKACLSKLQRCLRTGISSKAVLIEYHQDTCH